MLIDTHAHLTDERFDGSNEIIKNMAKDNLSKIISVGYDIESSAHSLKLAKDNENIFCAVGVHPSNSYDVESNYLNKLREMAKQPKCVAIGEIGLDYHYDDTNRSAQHKALIEQLQLAHELNLPVILHVRDADKDMLEIVKNNLQLFPKKGVVHCFSGSKETALEYIKMGFYISFTGVITFKNAKKFVEIISSLPKDKVLVETDCPYLSPEPFRGGLNQPSMVKYVASKIAEIWNVSEEEVAEITSHNAYSFFSKMKDYENKLNQI